MKQIAQLAGIRRVFEHLNADLTTEQLFHVPEGFRNNVAWNTAHVVVTQQQLCYGLSGLQPYLAPELIDAYRKGTGADTATEESYRQVMDYLHKGPELLAQDYAAGKFQHFQHYDTSAGVPLDSIEDAIAFNHFHEGIHLGSIMALRKFVTR